MYDPFNNNEFATKIPTWASQNQEDFGPLISRIKGISLIINSRNLKNLPSADFYYKLIHQRRISEIRGQNIFAH